MLYFTFSVSFCFLFMNKLRRTGNPPKFQKLIVINPQFYKSTLSESTKYLRGCPVKNIWELFSSCRFYSEILVSIKSGRKKYSKKYKKNTTKSQSHLGFKRNAASYEFIERPTQKIKTVFCCHDDNSSFQCGNISFNCRKINLDEFWNSKNWEEALGTKSDKNLFNLIIW